MESSAVSSTTNSTSLTSGSSLDQMKTEDFFQLLVAELQQQDPFEPTDTADMIGQVSQIRSIEQSCQLTDTLEQLTQQQRTTGVTDLIGKYVQALVADSDGTVVGIEGVVTSVYFSSDGVAVLELDTGQVVKATDVIRVTTPDQVELETVSSDEDDQAAAKSDATARANTSASSLLSLDGSLRL